MAHNLATKQRWRRAWTHTLSTALAIAICYWLTVGCLVVEKMARSNACDDFADSMASHVFKAVPSSCEAAYPLMPGGFWIGTLPPNWREDITGYFKAIKMREYRFVNGESRLVPGSGFPTSSSFYSTEFDSLEVRSFSLAVGHMLISYMFAVLGLSRAQRCPIRPTTFSTAHKVLFALGTSAGNALVLFLGIIVIIALPRVWASASSQSGSRAWIQIGFAAPSSWALAMTLYFITGIHLTKAIIRNRLATNLLAVGKDEPDSGQVGVKCWRCGYSASQLETCPECGQANPGADPRLYLTPFGSGIARRFSRRRLAVYTLSLLITIALAPVWIGITQMLIHTLRQTLR